MLEEAIYNSHIIRHVEKGLWFCAVSEILQMSHIMRKPVYAICEQRRRRSDCASAQSDQRLCCSLLGEYNISTFYNRNFKILASLCGWAVQFESHLVGNPEDRFSHDVAQMCKRSHSIGSEMWHFVWSLFPGETAWMSSLFSYMSVVTRKQNDKQWSGTDTIRSHILPSKPKGK